MAANQNMTAEEYALQLKRLNPSMFVKKDNPFSKSQRKKNRDEAMTSKQHDEPSEGDVTRTAEAYTSAPRQQKMDQELGDGDGVAADKKKNVAERSKYQFEVDSASSEDEPMEITSKTEYATSTSA